MANARRVTEAEALGEVDQTPTADLRRKYEQNVGPVSYIPETRYDDIRYDAYDGRRLRSPARRTPERGRSGRHHGGG